MSDAQTRADFSQNPHQVISAYQLTSAEEKAVLKPRMKTALAAGDSTILADGILENWF